MIPKPVRQALALWGLFFALAVLPNATIPFLAGSDLRAWTASTAKDALFGVLVYGGVFLSGPVLLVSDRSVVRRPGFSAPLALGVVGLGLRPWFPPAPLIALLVLAWLHLR